MKTKINRKNLTNKEILNEAQKYESLEEFKTKSHWHYLEAKTRAVFGKKLIDTATLHMGHGYVAKASEVFN